MQGHAPAPVQPPLGTGQAPDAHETIDKVLGVPVTPKAVQVMEGQDTKELVGLPDELVAMNPLWESKSTPSALRANAPGVVVRRLYSNGHLFTLSDQVISINAEGRPVSHAADRKWRLTAIVGDVGLVEAAIVEGFLSVPEGLAEGKVSDGTLTIWTGHLPDGRVHSIQRRGPTPTEVRTVEVAIAKGIIKGAVPLPHIP